MLDGAPLFGAVVEAIHADEPIVQAMVLTPTRELTAQVCEELAKIGYDRLLKVFWFGAVTR